MSPAGAGSLQHAAERVGFERVAEPQVFVEYGVALVPAELLEPGRVDATIHAGGERAALEAGAAEHARIETRRSPRALTMRATVPASIATVPTTGAGRGVSPGVRGEGGCQMRRNTGPAVMPAGSCQRRSARTGQSSVAP